MNLIYLENKSIVVQDETTNVILTSLDLFSFSYSDFTFGESEAVLKLSDGFNKDVIAKFDDSKDADGNTFASLDELKAYLSELSQQAANLGKSLKIDNMELSNTGSHVKLVNSNTGEQSFMVQQRVTDQGTQKVYYTELSEDEQVENAITAYQPSKASSSNGTLNAQNRYAMPIDFTSVQSVFIKEYRSESIADANGDGIKNLNVKIFNVTQTPENENDYRLLSGVGIDAGWYISKRPYWTLNKQATIDTKGGQDIAAGAFAFPFDQGFSFAAGESYRMVISADNNFELKGLSGAPNPFGGTQFIPYVERTYTGEVEVEVNTQSAKIFRDPINFFRDATNTSINTSQGDSYAVNSVKAIEDNGTIKIVHINEAREYYKQINHELVTIGGQLVNGSANDVVNALNALFTVTQGQLSTSITSPQVDALGAATTDSTYTNIFDPVGSSSYALASGSHGVVYSDERINESGEYFTFSILGKNYYGIGLFDDTADTDANGTSDHLGELQSQTTSRSLGNQWSLWIHPTTAVWTFYGQNAGFSYLEGYYSTDASIKFQTSAEYTNLATTPVGMKVGINNLGYLVVSYWNVAANRWVDLARTSYVLNSADYGLYLALGNTASQVYDSPKVHLVDEAAPILTYYAIESIDWKYPLFTTAEQADYYDTQNGGVGESTINIFPDDPTLTQWYAPANGYTSNGVSQPANGSGIVYNIVPTETLTPAAYTDTLIEVNEGETFNIAIDPADHNWTTQVTGESWATLSGGNLTGTAPAVTGDNVANPNDEFTFTIERTLEATSSGTLTIRVINLTAPVTPISGFAHVSGTTAMIDSDTMDDGSVVHVNNTVADGERFVIEQAYVETNILPALQASGDQYIIGLHNTASDFSTLEIADFDACIVWEYESATSHTFKFYRDGVLNQNIVINSITDSYYDYAIESNGTSAWLIACNVNSIMNEPSPADGGNFSHTYEVTNAEDAAPLQIHMAALNTTADISTTGIETLTTPAAPVGTTTPFNKALDFSGSSEYAAKVNSSYLYSPLNMGNAAVTVAAPTAGQTVSSGHPWATAIVFKVDGNASNQHIWNNGEGAGSTDDNIYLRLDANGQIYFGWGRTGALNECAIGSISTSQWYSVYIGFNGTRLSGANATAANLANAFDIRITNETTSWNDPAYNYSITANWTAGSVGGRMDRQFTGAFTVGGRSSNRNFHGKVAAMTVTTLRCGVAMPDATEIGLMLTNPIKWVEDYKLGNAYRRPSVTTDTANFALNSLDSASGTQLWLMGDGLQDSYANGIRSYIYPTEQNRSKLQFNSMVSNDIENVTIPGLS